MPDFLVLLIEDALENRGVTSRQAAVQIGIAHTTLNRIRQGGAYDLSTAKLISRWLGVRVSSVLDADEPASGVSPLAQQIALLIETEPDLARVFAIAMERLKQGEIHADTLRELVRYASFRLDIMNTNGERHEEEVQLGGHH